MTVASAMDASGRGSAQTRRPADAGTDRHDRSGDRDRAARPKTICQRPCRYSWSTRPRLWIPTARCNFALISTIATRRSGNSCRDAVKIARCRRMIARHRPGPPRGCHAPFIVAASGVSMYPTNAMRWKPAGCLHVVRSPSTSRRHRVARAKDRSTTQRFGKSTKPRFASGSLTTVQRDALDGRGVALVGVCNKTGGWGGIRTHEGLPPGGFQDRCLQPLGHPSAASTLL